MFSCWWTVRIPTPPNSAYSTANAISQSYAISLLRQPIASPLNMSTRILYNPDLNQLWFIMPGLLAALIQALTMNFTALAVVHERGGNR